MPMRSFKRLTVSNERRREKKNYHKRSSAKKTRQNRIWLRRQLNRSYFFHSDFNYILSAMNESWCARLRWSNIFFSHPKMILYIFPKMIHFRFELFFLLFTCFISDGVQWPLSVSFFFAVNDDKMQFSRYYKISIEPTKIEYAFFRQTLCESLLLFWLRLLLICCHYIVAHADLRCDFNLMCYNRNNEKTRK